MTTTKGLWRTEDGRKVEVVDVRFNTAIGWSNVGNHTWIANTGENTSMIRDFDIVEPWIEKPEWGWASTPPWLNWLAMDEGGFWYLHQGKPESRGSGWHKTNVWHIPEKHLPKWPGDWKDSLVGRPGAEVKL